MYRLATLVCVASCRVWGMTIFEPTGLWLFFVCMALAGLESMALAVWI